MGSNGVVARGAEQNVVLSQTRDVDVTVSIDDNIGYRLGADATTAQDPLERSVHSIEFSDEHFLIRNVDDGSTKIGLT